MRPCEHVLFENTHASHFTEAYPIGNGRLEELKIYTK